MPLIELENIIKTYKDGRVRAVNDVSLSINKGDFTAIVGHSGSGKSTLMNIIGCLDTPDSGRYALDGEEIFSLPSKRLAEIRNIKIGFIFQGFNLIPTLTAAENVELPLYYRGIKQKARKRASAQALEMVGLAERADHKPTELSGGQQQRVAIARAVAASPPVILADEPTGNLDPKSGAEVMKILCGLHRNGHTIVLITHDFSVAEKAERVITVDGGKIIC